MLRKVLLTVLVVAAVATSWSGLLDEAGRDTAEQAFRRALVTFAIARTLNGVISVAQGTEVAVEPAGVGVNFAPGQVLDPINDLVERFSSVMLVASSALGLQNILLRISAWIGVDIVLGLGAVALLVALWANVREPYQRWAYRFAMLAIGVRFAVPLVVIGTGLFFDTFLEAEHTAATEALQATSEEIRELSDENVPPAPDPETGLIGRVGAFIGDSLDNANVGARMERFRDGLSNASEHIINLIVIFTLQTIVVPIAFLWLLAQALRRLI